jgi:hypothetical protein
VAEPFLSEIRVFSFQFAPKGWAQCNGELLPINQNSGFRVERRVSSASGSGYETRTPA